MDSSSSDIDLVIENYNMEVSLKQGMAPCGHVIILRNSKRWDNRSHDFVKVQFIKSKPFKGSNGKLWYLKAKLMEGKTLSCEAALYLQSAFVEELMVFVAVTADELSTDKRVTKTSASMFSHQHDSSPDFMFDFGTQNTINIGVTVKAVPVKRSLFGFISRSCSEYVLTGANGKSESKCSRDFRSLLDSGDNSDFVIDVDGVAIPCHRNIISCRSSFFAAMFRSEFSENKENRVRITGFAATTIQDLISYLYTAYLPKLTVDRALQLLRAADMYDVPDLKEECEKFLSKNIAMENAFDILLFSDIYSATSVKRKAFDFVEWHLPAFEHKQFDVLLKSPKLLKELLIAQASAASASK